MRASIVVTFIGVFGVGEKNKILGFKPFTKNPEKVAKKLKLSETQTIDEEKALTSELKKKGLRLAIISNAPKLKAWLRLAALRIDDYFDVIITADDVSRDKPSRLVFRTALRKLKLKPSSCLMVGDKPHIDIIVPNQIGMKTCFAKYGYMGEDIPKVEADFVIDNITELVKIV